MSSKSSIICDYGVHIYHEWADKGFVYVRSHGSDGPIKLCSLEDWFKIIKLIKTSDKDCNGKDWLTGKYDFEIDFQPVAKEEK